MEKEISLVRIIGEPTTPNEAATLADEHKNQFQWWALGLVVARSAESREGRRGQTGFAYDRSSLDGRQPVNRFLKTHLEPRKSSSHV